MKGQATGDRVAFSALVMAAVILGGILGVTRTFPFPEMLRGAQSLKALISGGNRPEVLRKITYPGSGLVVHHPQIAQPGLTIIQGILPGGNQIRVLGANGVELHRWHADFFKIWPDASDIFPKERIPVSEMHYYTHGMHARPDGSILVNFSGLGVALLDRCSRPIWRASNWMHHSITPANDGRYWIPGHIPLERTPREYLPHNFSAERLNQIRGDGYAGYNNSVMLVNSDGTIDRELSVLESIYEAGLENAIYASQQEYIVDPTHINDIEVVTAALAEKIETAEAGDLLLSLRAMNLVAIIDEATGELKWHQQGPWLRQHDVDITEDGNIELFNNRFKNLTPTVDTSQIVRFDPVTRQTEVIHPAGENDKFYSEIMGSHQALDNGNRLIVESTAGRVFETTPQGAIVWDFRLPFDSETTSLISDATRVPVDYFNEGALGC